MKITSKHLADTGFKEPFPNLWVFETCSVVIECITPDKDPEWRVNEAGVPGPQDTDQLELFMKMIGGS